MRRGITYVDCRTPMADERNGMKRDYGFDGVHRNNAGYSWKSELTEAGIAEALKAEPPKEE